MITYKDNGIGYDEHDSEADDGTMRGSLNALKEAVVGHRIVAVNEKPEQRKKAYPWEKLPALELTLDDGSAVTLIPEGDCCAFTHLRRVIEHLDTVDHIITNVTHDGDFEKWYIVADLGNVLELQVAWSAGNPFYYGYGFSVMVERPEAVAA